METNVEIHEPLKGWVRATLIIFPFIFVIGISQMIGSLIVGLKLSELSSPKSPFQEMIIYTFGLIGTYIVVGFFRRFIDDESFQSMGFYALNWVKEAFIGIVLGGTIIFVGFFLLV